MAKWDPSRFLNTVGYFGAIPIFSDVQRWLTGESKDRVAFCNATRTITDGGRALGLVLVIGASGEIGQLVVGQLLKSGYRVRAAISDLSLAPFSVPANVEYVQVDPNSLNLSAQIMAGVRSRSVAECKSIIICPEENSLSPAVFNNLTAAASTYLAPITQLELFDFTQSDLNLQATWGAVDDVVMGGVSESGIRLADGYALFSGNVSTDNSGGFASVRTRNFEPSFNLSNYHGIELRVKGDGQRYKLFVRTETRWDGVGYAYSFDTIADEWITIQVPFQDLVPIFRAKTVNDAPLDTTQICSLQLMLSKFEYDKALNPRFTPGLFALQVESISAYGGQNLPQLVVINSIPLPVDLVPNLQATNLQYSIVQSGTLDAQMVAMIAVKSLSQPEAVGQIFGH
jgi:Complex I intermediate-associated protein 30 (CIA30)